MLSALPPTGVSVVVLGASGVVVAVRHSARLGCQGVFGEGGGSAQSGGKL